MQILQESGNDWREKSLISKLYVDQSIKYDWTTGRQDVWRLEEKSDNDVVCHRFYSTCIAAWPAKLLTCLETSEDECKYFAL